LKATLLHRAIHVGDAEFNARSDKVYAFLAADVTQSVKPAIEELLEYYPVLLYNGINDIVCHHAGVVAMINSMEQWSFARDFPTTESQIWQYQSQTAGYLTSVGNLRLLALRNANHRAPRDAPGATLKMFQDFISGKV